mmetsp:Transcript_6405/g.19426  ORF Transcript_6405/g.19426 Transcript_6405/m.19426 type:complete len:461 (+) Transcript_6405:23-1405(+)
MVYWTLFGCSVVGVLAVELCTRHVAAKDTTEGEKDAASSKVERGDPDASIASVNISSSLDQTFVSFQQLYLVVFFLAMASDWLQGPYVYALYDAYGYEKDKIALLFICGFLASMLVGTFVGSLADKLGRKRLALAFCVIYGISCLTKLSPNFHMLLLGRLTGGTATSLLFSVFESWMVCEHRKRNFDQSLLPLTFSRAIFGNCLVAIVCGLVASFVVQQFGVVAPFMVSLGILIVCFFIVLTTWSENHGDSSGDSWSSLSQAVDVLRNDPNIITLGFIQSLFEGSMYTFVFMWSPTLMDDPMQDPTSIPFGLVFATFMVAAMLGSSIFGVLLRWGWSVVGVLKTLLALGAAALAVPYFAQSRLYLMLGFLVFEMCVGMYFPSIGTLRSEYIPEAHRSTIMNFFRVPLNFLVVIVLLKVKHMENDVVFAIITVWMVIALCLVQYLLRPPRIHDTKHGATLE